MSGMKRATSVRSSGKKNQQMGGTSQTDIDETADRTQQIANRLKDIYATSVHPVEKRYRYDYFFESPYLTNVEFDGTYIYLYRDR
jgi:N-terminal EH-domain containing protein